MGKYEYMVTLWGGFFNDGNDTQGIEEGTHWFKTYRQREKFIKRAKRAAEDIGQCVAMNTEEGTHVRLKTIVKMVFEFQGVRYHHTADMGYAYPHDAALFMWTDGNYGCDCNRARFLSDEYPEIFCDMEGCGDEIQMISIVIESVATQ